MTEEKDVEPAAIYCPHTESYRLCVECSTTKAQLNHPND